MQSDQPAKVVASGNNTPTIRPKTMNAPTMTHTKTPFLKNIAGLAVLSTAALLTTHSATSAEQPRSAKVKSKQCVILYSPRYKKLRIKPIQFSFRWCSASNPNDCTKWTNDKVADVGKPFSIVAHCFTHHTRIKMELRYNQRFDDVSSQLATTIQPHAMPLRENLTPHPFCGKKAAHRFVMTRSGARLKAGRPRNVQEPKCVWQPVKPKAAS